MIRACLSEECKSMNETDFNRMAMTSEEEVIVCNSRIAIF